MKKGMFWLVLALVLVLGLMTVFIDSSTVKTMRKNDNNQIPKLSDSLQSIL
ncbi:hypothetical protein [Caldisalinibacter kiritimatiensis]|uniref:Uncharacterized protein n=1 Tax=Caldisalinibacter kiritimatiensis TaxID=1304284 RepID=R1ARS1_9FIRM|nr:hypothetical protein [Caldisalinibacter kiritimatiensis]EOC99847.1 hypothetical protein L21TH_2152 [Caldisalinibacter kiritimatiensis]